MQRKRLCKSCRERKASAWRAFRDRVKQTVGPVDAVPGQFFAAGEAERMRRDAERAYGCQFVFRREGRELVLVPWERQAGRVERLRWKPERMRKGFAW